MRKGWKVFWITCAVIFAIGMALCITALCLGVTTEAIWERFPNGAAVYNSDTDYLGEGSAEYMEEAFDGIDSIEVNVTRVALKFLESDTDKVKLKTDNVSSNLKFNCYAEDGELFVSTETEDHFWHRKQEESGTILIYVPAGYHFSEVQLNLEVGKLEADRISAESLDIRVGAGAADIGEFIAKEVDMKCGAGQIVAKGSELNEMDIDCGVGQIDVTVDGQKEDYSYLLQCGIGQINIDGETYSGLNRKREIDHNTGGEIDVKCRIGQVGVRFNEHM